MDHNFYHILLVIDLIIHHLSWRTIRSPHHKAYSLGLGGCLFGGVVRLRRTTPPNNEQTERPDPPEQAT